MRRERERASPAEAAGLDMRCSLCGSDDTKVLDTRPIDQGVRRRRQCKKCGARFSTMERPQAASLSVLKRDGRTEEFNRGKLVQAIRTASIKRPFRAGTIEKLVDEIEEDLQKQGRVEVSTRAIGELAMDKLSKIDPVAYIRFASVYRDFTDPEDFRQTVEALADGTASGSVDQLALIPPERSGGRPRGRPRRRPEGAATR